ncbi:MAG: chromosomal replication initiator protein DnaA [Phycisphaeraceae bacterium]|nr:MAG: chromosomal replication initiator protein DnaA [Phycisphaeraceae bacterium]
MADPDRAIWEGILAYLRSHTPNICRQWFSELVPLGVAGGALGVRAHSDLHRDYLRREALDACNDAARTVTGQLLAVRFLGPDDPWDDAPTAAAAPNKETFEARAPRAPGRATERVAHSGTDNLPVSPDYDFDSFVVGPNNRLAHAAARGVCESPGSAYNPLFIHGGVGLGKTHLLQAVCLEIRQRTPDATIVFISCEAFLTRFMDAVQNGKMTAFRDQFREADVLLIDDIHFLSSRDRTQEEFFHTFNALHQAGKQIILSSDAPPEEIPDLEERLVSRFQWGLVAKVDRPGFDTRVEILKRKAQQRGLKLPDDVACHVAARLQTHIRQLEGALSTLAMNAAVEERDIDLELAQRALPGPAPAKASSGPSIEFIISTVVDYYRVKKTDVLGKRRHKSISLPRQVCMYLARTHTRHSLEEIGAQIGGRDHTTVIHAVRSIEAKRGGDTDFADVVSSLETQIRAAAAGRD